MSRTYPARPIVGVGVAVLRDDTVLLVRRGRPPALGEWSLPGGAQELGETAEAAARREVLEETGIHIGALHLAAIVDSIHPDEAGGIEYHYTIIDYAARWHSGTLQAASDVTDAAWVRLDDLNHYTHHPQTHHVITRALALLGR